MTTLDPKRGEIWLIDLNPTIGAEINKLRPAVVVSSDSIRKLALRLVVPLTGWQSDFANNIWLVKITNDTANGLDKESAADALQARGVSLQRFVKKIGYLPADTLQEIATAIAIVCEYE